MSRWLIRARVMLALGLPNIARVVGYRVGVRLGINPARRLSAATPAGPFFSGSHLEAISVPTVTDWHNTAHIFSHWSLALDDAPPDWLANPLTGQRMPQPERSWWQIPDFHPAVGDIKLIWELSRMDWVLAFSQRVRQGDPEALVKLNGWLADWCAHNPPYRGANWKCGQEASIRVMHIAAAALLLGQVHEVQQGLRDLLVVHIQRIEPTVQYAMAQDNNHGTSEAAALFIGGSWLSALGDERGARWAVMGRKLFENRASRLIGEQGTFSQYSLNYHRLMLDTLSITECWRRTLNLAPFSPIWRARARAATRWLYALVDPNTGDGPNVGANDGARLLQLSATGYRDYRPSVQLASVLFADARAYSSDGSWNHAMQWLGLELPEPIFPATDILLADDGGFMALRRGGAMALLRYPRFRFRPSQADVLHLDLWLAGQACLRDGGTYSYNADPKWLDYFGGVEGHNTVQFDGREQMPRLSRFLLGGWLRTETLESVNVYAHGVQGGAGYRDASGASHHRHVQLEDGLLRVRDQVQGFKHSAVLRWRLAPGAWQMLSQSDASAEQWFRINNGNGHTLTVTADMPIVRCKIVEGWESLYYLEKTKVPVLELEVAQPGTLISEYHWAA